VASMVLLGFGMLDVAALNLLLAPRLARMSVRPAAPLQRDEGLALEPEARRMGPAEPDQAPEPPGTRGPAEVWAAARSSGTAGAARKGRAAPDITFSRDSAVVRGLPALRALGRVQEELGREPARELLLRGHSDPAGIPAYNLDLARRRAETVKANLVKRGADPA